MTTVCRRITDEGRLAPTMRDEISNRTSPTTACYWVDLVAPEPDESAGWLDAFGAPALIRRFAEEPATTRVFDVAEAVWFSVPVLRQTDHSSTTFLSGFIAANALLTFHEQPVEALETARAAIEQHALLLSPDTPGLLARLCAQVAHRTVTAGKTLRDRVIALARRQEQDPEDVDIEEILQCGSALDDLDAVVEDQLYWLRALKGVMGQSVDIRGAAKDLEVAIGNLVFLERTVDRLEKRVDDLRGRFDLLLAERTNRRLGFPTILSAVFLPLTLIAGIYGMNFERMPELGLPYAYPIALMFMAVTAGGMLWYFWRRGWFE